MESKYFSSTPINTGRQPELDFVKAFMIVLMLLDHACCELYNLENVIVVIVSTSITFIGAGMFMICTGIGMCYSRHQSPFDFVKRGISLLTVGQLLNLCRYFIPYTVFWLISGNEYFADGSILTISNDIMQFAGLAFLVMAFVKKMKFKSSYVLIFAFFLNIVGYILGTTLPQIDNYILRQIVGNFVLTQSESYFPLCSYFVFIAFGVWIGEKYPYMKDKNLVANRILS